jgi:hypothetical protein
VRRAATDQKASAFVVGLRLVSAGTGGAAGAAMGTDAQSTEELW